MVRKHTATGPSNFRLRFPGGLTRESSLEVDAWMLSEINAISPLVDRLMPLIAAARCITGQESAVELALREALSNAVIHGNRPDGRKRVHIRCRCQVGKGVSLVVSDQGQGFDVLGIPDPFVAANLTERGRGIQLMKASMDEISFQRGGAEVRMCKRKAHPASGARATHKAFER